MGQRERATGEAQSPGDLPVTASLTGLRNLEDINDLLLAADGPIPPEAQGLLGEEVRARWRLLWELDGSPGTLDAYVASAMAAVSDRPGA